MNHSGKIRVCCWAQSCIWMTVFVSLVYSSEKPATNIDAQGRDLPTKERSWTLVDGQSILGRIMEVDPKTNVVKFKEMTATGEIKDQKFPLLGFIKKDQEFLNRWQTGVATGNVVGITDGDTFNLLTPGSELLKIRLHGVDAPELQQAFNKKAKKQLSDLIYKQTVTVHLRKTKSFERFVGTVYKGNTNICLEMVKSGFSWHATEHLKDNEAYATAQADAEEQELGLWVDKARKAPWDYRHRGKKPRTAEELIEKGAKLRVMEPRFLSLRKPSERQATIKFKPDGRSQIMHNLTAAIWSPPPRVQQFWVTKNSQVRHNEYCRFFKKSGNGELIKHLDGKPCSFCGG